MRTTLYALLREDLRQHPTRLQRASQGTYGSAKSATSRSHAAICRCIQP